MELYTYEWLKPIYAPGNIKTAEGDLLKQIGPDQYNLIRGNKTHGFNWSDGLIGMWMTKGYLKAIEVEGEPAVDTFENNRNMVIHADQFDKDGNAVVEGKTEVVLQLKNAGEAPERKQTRTEVVMQIDPGKNVAEPKRKQSMEVVMKVQNMPEKIVREPLKGVNTATRTAMPTDLKVRTVSANAVGTEQGTQTVVRKVSVNQDYPAPPIQKKSHPVLDAALEDDKAPVSEAEVSAVLAKTIKRVNRRAKGTK